MMPNHLAVVGFSDYQGKIDCVDGWLHVGDPKAEAYNYLLENAGEYVRVREIGEVGSSFLINCRKEHRPEALQSLALLFNSKGNYIGMDGYDVFSSMPCVVDCYFHEIVGDAYLDEMKAALAPNLEYIREHPEQDWVTWVQLEGDYSVMPNWDLLREVLDKLDSLTDDLLN